MTEFTQVEGASGKLDASAEDGMEDTMAELCPKCGGGALQRSRRRVFEYPLSLFHIWPFRCKICQARSLKYSKASFK